MVEAAINFNAKCDERLKDRMSTLWSLSLASADEQNASIPPLQIEQMWMDQRQAASLDGEIHRVLDAEQRAAIGLP